MRLIALLAIAAGLAVGAAATAAEPSFDCSKAESSAEEAVCASEALAALDLELARLYKLALADPNLTAQERDELKATQRGWIKGRNECWKSSLPMEVCVAGSYGIRIHDLRQGSAAARSQDDAGVTIGPVAFRCTGMQSLISAVFINTPRSYVTLKWGEGGDIHYLVLPQAPAASGARYALEEGAGRTAQFWNKGNDATFKRPDGTETTCAVEETG